METRGTMTAGVIGADQAIDRFTAVDLYTRAAARLAGDGDLLGAIQPGFLADFVAYDFDPLSVDVEKLPESTPILTVMGGRATHDPQRRLDSSTKLRDT
jgi:predicted amidohydrolase YtcJ